MADFDGTIDPPASWADVPDLSVTAVAKGGPSGAMNAQAIALAARTKQLDATKVSQTDISSGALQLFSSGAPLPGVSARFQANQQITTHAQYAFLDNSTVTYSGNGFQGHASFNDNVKHTGTQNSDHHHSFQAYPHYGSTGTLGRLSCFWSQPDVTAGAVTELSQFKASNALGTGGIFTQYGLYVEPLTRGNANYAIYVNGPTVSYFGGALVLGQIGNPAYIQYNTNTGHLDLIPRSGFGVNTDAPLMFGGGSGFPAQIAYNPSGNLDITPRVGYGTSITSGPLLVGLSTPAAGEKLNVSGATASNFVSRFYNTTTTAPSGIAVVFPNAAPNNTTQDFAYFQDSGAIRCRIQSNGNIVNVGNSYGAISDVNLKENIVDTSSKLEKLLQVRIVNYNLISEPGVKHIGVIAQELEKIWPGLVERIPDFEDVIVEPARVAITVSQVQKTVLREIDDYENQLIDGTWRRVSVKRTINEPLFENHQVFDDGGQPIKDLFHQVPVMEDVETKTDVAAVIERRATGTFTLSVKYSLLVPILIKSLQEQHALIKPAKKK